MSIVDRVFGGFGMIVVGVSFGGWKDSLAAGIFAFMACWMFLLAVDVIVGAIKAKTESEEP
jgi:hypothetical protein